METINKKIRLELLAKYNSDKQINEAILPSGSIGKVAAALGGTLGVAAASSTAIVTGLGALALIPLAYWLITKDTGKSKVEKLFSYCETNKTNIEKLPRGLSDTVISQLSDKLYDAMQGVGTDEESIYSVFNSLKSTSDLSTLINKFGLERGDLLEWLDDDIDQENEWEMIYRPIRNLVTKDLLKIEKTIPGVTAVAGKTVPTKKKFGYHVCNSFPFGYGCKSETIKEIQRLIMLPEKYQTSNFGPITLKKLREFTSGKNITIEDVNALNQKNPQITSGLFDGLKAVSQNITQSLQPGKLEKIPTSNPENFQDTNPPQNLNVPQPPVNQLAENMGIKQIKENVDEIKNFMKRLI